MSTLHDRIAALADDFDRIIREASVNLRPGTYTAGYVNGFQRAVHDLRAVLVETTTAQPEADAVERAARALAGRWAVDTAWEEWSEAARNGWRDDARAALAAAQPVACSLPHLVPVDESEDDGFGELPPWRPLAAQPEPAEREALARLVAAASYQRLTFRGQADAVLAAGFRRSRPEATHTVTAEQVHAARERADARASRWSGRWAEHYLAALGVTVADTPTQAGDDA